jgi:WhiB family redox-sensing transcriptional regulator
MVKTGEYPVSEEWFIGAIDRSQSQLPLSEDPDYAWESDALCAQTNPEAFFPEKGGSVREAKRTCLSCDVARQCLKWALENDEQFGIRGGLSPGERKKIIKNPSSLVVVAEKAWANKSTRGSRAQQEAA